MLNIINKYSPTLLKYEKKISINTDKINYKLKLSDIHYEIDMSLLGCNSKYLWHEIFIQIIEIIQVNPLKFGIIVCYNFQDIHSELLDIFYSYMQQYNHNLSHITVKFIIISEQISFLPSNIINNSHILNIKHIPNKSKLDNMSKQNFNSFININKIDNVNIPKIKKNIIKKIITNNNINNINTKNNYHINSFNYNNNYLITNNYINNFNIICDNVISVIKSQNNLDYLNIRDILYDILTYNLNISESIWYILKHIIISTDLTPDKISNILIKSFLFFKYFNNNYRPIYHLENIVFYIINIINDNEISYCL
jgi:hypothetical protein